MLMNIFESIKSFFINYFSFGDIIKELLPGFIIACLTALACFVYNRNSKRFYTALHKAMYGVAKYDKDSYKVFKNYIPHMLTKITHRDTDAEETVSFKEFCKKIERDEIKAFKCYEKSAKAGFSVGMCVLGWCYKHGYGTAENKVFAFEWFEKSANCE